jgi:hypothetical protein
MQFSAWQRCPCGKLHIIDTNQFGILECTCGRMWRLHDLRWEYDHVDG